MQKQTNEQFLSAGIGHKTDEPILFITEKPLWCLFYVAQEGISEISIAAHLSERKRTHEDSPQISKDMSGSISHPPMSADMILFVLKWHLLFAAVGFSLPSVISAMLIMCPRAASTLIQLKTLMEHNQPRSFPHFLTNGVGI